MHDAASTADVARYFRSSRTNFPEYNAIEPSQPHRLRAFVTNNFSGALLADAKAYADRVAAGPAWGQILFHEIVAGTPGSNQWTQADFDSLMDYIAAKGCAVRTTTQVLDKI